MTEIIMKIYMEIIKVILDLEKSMDLWKVIAVIEEKIRGIVLVLKKL